MEPAIFAKTLKTAVKNLDNVKIPTTLESHPGGSLEGAAANLDAGNIGRSVFDVGGLQKGAKK